MLRREFIKQSGLALGGVLASVRMLSNTMNNKMRKEKE